MTWVTSDHHFDHQNVLRYCPDRPWRTVREMNDRLVELWNERVGPDDLVLYLGDFHLGTTRHVEPHVRRLNGQILLVRGNHDRCSAGAYLRAGFWGVTKEVRFDYRGLRVLATHKPCQVVRQTDWTALKGVPIRISRNGRPVVYETVLDPDFDVRLCGHVHQHWTTKYNNVNVGVDVRGFAPVRIEELLDPWVRFPDRIR